MGLFDCDYLYDFIQKNELHDVSLVGVESVTLVDNGDTVSGLGKVWISVKNEEYESLMIRMDGKTWDVNCSPKILKIIHAMYDINKDKVYVNVIKHESENEIRIENILTDFALRMYCKED